MHKVHTTYGIIVSWQMLKHTVQRPLQGRTYCPTMGNMVSRQPPVSVPAGSALVLKSLLIQCHALPEGGEYKGHSKF